MKKIAVLIFLTLAFVQCTKEKITNVDIEMSKNLLKEFSERRLYHNMNSGSSERNKEIMNNLLNEKNIIPESFYTYMKKNQPLTYNKLFGSK